MTNIWPAFEEALLEFNRKNNVDWTCRELQDNTARDLADRAFEIDDNYHHADSIPINICNLANFILGREAVTGGDFAEAGLAIMGGCKQCAASIACYNAYPAQDGYWRCGDCIGDYGYESVEAALMGIFPEKCAYTVFCADCKMTYDQNGGVGRPRICGACGSDFIAVKFLPVSTAIRLRRAEGQCDCESESCSTKSGHAIAGCLKPGTVKTTHNTICVDCAVNYPVEYLSTRFLG